MFKKYFIVIIFIIVVGVSGCTTKTATNGTFGEKVISTSLISLSNNSTVGTQSYNGTNYYYVKGYLQNNNTYDAFNVNVISTAYDASGNVVATNVSAYLNPTSIPSKGVSEFYVDFPDNNNNIVSDKVKVVNASGTI